MYSFVWRAVEYLDRTVLGNYNKSYVGKTLEVIDIHYLYMRSFFPDIKMDDTYKKIHESMLVKLKKEWNDQSRYQKVLSALVLYRNGMKEDARMIMNDIKKTAIISETEGMYWNDEHGYYWYRLPIETHTLMIEAFLEITQDREIVDNLKVWLLKQRKDRYWYSTKATAEACYALLLDTKEVSADPNLPIIIVGNKPIEVSSNNNQGHFSTIWSSEEITREMGKVTVVSTSDSLGWGALYWKYFENNEKITENNTMLKVNRTILKNFNVGSRTISEPVSAATELKPGDKLTIRIDFTTEKNLEYVHLKDLRASCFEPGTIFSEYKYQNSLAYFITTKDASTNFFFNYIPAGSYSIEYQVYITHTGNFSAGISTMQCMYSPEIVGHSAGMRIVVKGK